MLYVQKAQFKIKDANLMRPWLHCGDAEDFCLLEVWQVAELQMKSG